MEARAFRPANSAPNYVAFGPGPRWKGRASALPQWLARSALVASRTNLRDAFLCAAFIAARTRVFSPRRPPHIHATLIIKRSPQPPMIHITRETHEAPASIQRRIALAGGANRYGEPNFRVVWGGSRLTWIGGRWTDRDAHGNAIREAIELRQVPKYAPLDRWHIERWTPPESYGSPDSWYRANDGNRRRHPHPRSRPVSIARRIRTLLHARKRRRRIHPAHARRMRLDHPRRGVVAPPSAPDAASPSPHAKPAAPANSTPPPTPSSPPRRGTVRRGGRPAHVLGVIVAIRRALLLASSS